MRPGASAGIGVDPLEAGHQNGAMRSVTARRAGSLGRGTPRNPGADLARLPVGFDPRGIRLAEGVRAALACAVILLLYEWRHWTPLVYAALAAFLTCLCDTGGPIRTRIPMLLTFPVLGAVIWAGFGLARGAGLGVALPLAGVGILCTSFARVWGVGPTAVGNLLSVVMILALDQALGVTQASVIAASFAAGGLWATLLTVVIWRLHPYRPAQLAVAEVWRRVAALSGDLLTLARKERVSVAEWDAHARAHRRAVREEIEYARAIVLDLVSMRGRLSLRGSQALLRLEAGDQAFGTLIALSDLLEGEENPARRREMVTLLRLVRPVMLVLSRSMVSDRPVRVDRLERALAKASSAAGQDPALARIAAALVDRLHITAKLTTPGGYLHGGAVLGDVQPRWWDRVRQPVLANLDWNSAMLRHALRTAVVAVPSLAATQIWGGVFAHWLPITVIVTLQPFYAATWQRALERVGGTVLGGLAGAGMAVAARTPGALAALMFPLCIVAFAARQVSFGTYIACITPIVVVLIELIEPGHSAWAVAAERALFVIAGGLVAVLGWVCLWPSWEPDRVRREQSAALAAHARYAEAVIGELLGECTPMATEGARRAAGVATNNLEESLGRALQEPRRGQRAWLEAAMLVDATVRRIAGRLSALRHDVAAREALDVAGWRRWREWITASLCSLAADGGLPAPRPNGTIPEGLARIARQIELLDGVLRRPRPQTGVDWQNRTTGAGDAKHG